MADHTVVNLKDVEDQAPRFGFAPHMEARFAADDLGLERSAVSYQRLAPGFRQPFGHSHREQEEIYVVVTGGGRAKLGDDVIDLGPLDAIRVPPGTVRCFEGGPDGLEMLAIGAPRAGGPGQDAVPAPDFWTD